MHAHTNLSSVSSLWQSKWTLALKISLLLWIHKFSRRHFSSSKALSIPPELHPVNFLLILHPIRSPEGEDSDSGLLSEGWLPISILSLKSFLLFRNISLLFEYENVWVPQSNLSIFSVAFSLSLTQPNNGSQLDTKVSSDPRRWHYLSAICPSVFFHMIAEFWENTPGGGGMTYMLLTSCILS